MSRVISGHFFLLNLVVDYVAGSKLTVNILNRYAHLNHKHHCVIQKIGKLIFYFFRVGILGGNDNFCCLLSHFLENLV